MQIIIEAASLRDARLAWQVAHYQRFAYHAPNEMPEEPTLERDRPASTDVAHEIQEIRRRVKLAYDTKRAKRHGG